MQEGFACLCVCIPHGCLVPVEARGACQISWNRVFWIHSLVVSKPLGAPPTEQRTGVHLWYGPHPAVQVSCDQWCCSFVDDWSQHGKQLALDLHWSWRLIQQQSKKSSSTFSSYLTQSHTGYSPRGKTAGALHGSQRSHWSTAPRWLLDEVIHLCYRATFS